MRIFNKDSKVNFVDRYNTLVGFDNHQHCREEFGWSVSQRPGNLSGELPPEEHLEEYIFAAANSPICEGNSDGTFGSGPDEEGGFISFLLIATGKPDLYLTLFNHHNGYYTHGFHMDCGGKLALEGEL